MKLAAIYNVWDGEELLKGSIDCLRKHVDLVIIIYQDISNFGESHSPLAAINEATEGIGAIIRHYEPTIQGGFGNEKSKRNLGIDIARNNGCTHFLHIDCDEYYQDFGAAKQEYIDSRADGSVCKMFTYFKKPIWRLEQEDNYYVPFIHKFENSTVAGIGTYPYYVDPTRKISLVSTVAILKERMHHFSYIRKDIERKCRNSSAKANIEKSYLLMDYFDPQLGPGFYVKDFRQRLVEVDNLFGIQT
jgi:hypothetical protein